MKFKFDSMSEYYRFFDIHPTDHFIKKEHGNLSLNGSLELDIVFVPDADNLEDYEAMYRTDFTGFKNHMSVHSGYRGFRAVPKFAGMLLSMFGADLSVCYDVALGALYEESGFDTYSREECDSMYVNSVLRPVKNRVLRGVLGGIVMPLVGNRMRWNNSSEQTSVATLQPQW